MSYLHRPGVPPGAAAGGPGGQEARDMAGARGPGGMMIGGPQQHQQQPLQHPGGMPGRLGDLLDYVKGEFEAVASQAEILRRDNHEYASHADMHLAEVSAIRRELAELEREHSRAKQAYEKEITALKRELDAMRAQSGQGPPIPTVIPANTNHFGALMGHPHGMFGQGGPDRERVEMERERAGEQRDGKMVNGGHSNGPHAGSMAAGPGPGHAAAPPGSGHPAASAGGPGSGMPSQQQQQQQQQGRPGQQHGHPSQQPHHYHPDARESLHERDAAAYQQQLGKRTRPDEPMYDGQPPSAKSRMGEGGRPLENGVESRTSAAASFPPVRPPSRTFAQSPHPIPGRPMSSASGGPPPTIANAPPSEPPLNSLAGPSNANVDVKPSIGSLNPPIQLQRPPTTQNTAPPHGQNASAAPQAPEDRAPPQSQQQAKKPDGQPPASAHRKTPDWDVTYNQEVPKKLEVALAHTFLHDSVVCCVRISPDGKLLATGCNRNTTLYDTKTGAIVAQLAEEIEGKPDNYIRAVAFSPDGKRIASGSEDKIIRIWDLASRQLVATLRGHDSEIYSLAFSPDGTQIVSGSGDRTARIWSVDQRRILKELRIDETRKLENGTVLDAGVTSISISPDGKLIVAGSLDHIVRIWDMKTGQLLDRLKNHKDSVYSVAFLPGGKQLLTGSLDKTLKIWDLNPLRQAMTSGQKIDPEAGHTVCKQTFWGHKDFVLSVAASPDGNWIASGSKDRAVQCWDVRTGKAQFVLHGHKNSVISIAMSEVGGLLATGSGDWQARIFKITGMDEPASSTSASASAAAAPSATATSTTEAPARPNTISLSAAIARTVSPLPPQSASQAPQQPLSAKSSAGAPTPKPTQNEASAKAKPEATKENGSTNGVNGTQRPKEAPSAGSPATTSAPSAASASAPQSAKEVLTQKDGPAPSATAAAAAAPTPAPATAPSSPGAMNVDPPVEEAPKSTEKPASKEPAAAPQNGAKEDEPMTNGDDKPSAKGAEPATSAEAVTAP